MDEQNSDKNNEKKSVNSTENLQQDLQLDIQQINKNIIIKPIDQEMKSSYIDYAMSVIVGRALPDVRDGLKPVHRRILYAMNDLGIVHNKPFKKSARIVGECLGKYHPHGDTAVYDSLVRMAQNFSLRYPLIDGQGNFGCFTKDTKVLLADGRSLSFEELIKENKDGKKNYSYTIDKNMNIKIAEIKNPRLTKKDQSLIKVILDNDEEIRCTLNHKFMLRNGDYKEAQSLQTGDSLMPLYNRLSTKEDDINIIGYTMVYNPSNDKWTYTHHLADEFNIINNITDAYKKKRNNDQQFRDKYLKIFVQHRDKAHYYKFLNICKKIINSGKEINEENYETERIKNGAKRIILYQKAVSKYFDNNEIKINEVLQQRISKLNHKVFKIEFLNEKEDVYDLTIDETHNFALAAGIFVHNSVDGDNPASMRYTEARTKKIAEEMLEDLEKETVLFVDNFDSSLKEPSVLPSKIPNLLINGSSGIAVGMATNIPPHNLIEICTATIRMLENPEMSISEILQIVHGPDFPTGGIICGRNGIAEYFSTGRGKVLVRGKVNIEKKQERESIIITEIPYMTNKALLVQAIAEHVKNKIIEGISDIRDESDREGMRVVIELKRDAVNEVVLNNLYKHTNLQTTFGIILLSLVKNQPKILSIKTMLEEFIKHRKEIVIKRTEFDLRKAEERAHILEGLIIALNNIDSAVALIKASKSVEIARQGLMSSFSLSEIQANAILEMKLQRLTSLEQNKIREEHTALLEIIRNLKDILAKTERVIAIIIEELRKLIEDYGDKRRTEISETDEQLEIEDLIPDEPVVITITHSGYIKRLPITTYKSQRRGGKGIVATTTKEEDFVEDIFIANTHDYILCFTNDGKVNWLKVYKIPEASRIAKGKAIVNLLDLPDNTRVTTVIPIRTFDDKHNLLMVTNKGIVKKTNLSAYGNVRAGGIIAITLDEGDELVSVLLTDGNKQILVATRDGNAVKFREEDARPIGRSGRGVIGIRLDETDKVIGAVIADDSKTLFTITENGYGKRTEISEYRLINRGGSGVINIQCSDRNGKVVVIKSVVDDDEIMLISKNGIIIRMLSHDISVIGRNTQGMRIMKLESGDKVVSAAKVVNDEKEVVV